MLFFSFGLNFLHKFHMVIKHFLCFIVEYSQCPASAAQGPPYKGYP